MNRHKQQGATLFVALIALVVLTIMAIAAINSGIINLRITNNMQARDEAMAAAQQAIEITISSNFTTNVAAAAMTHTIQINNDKSYSVDIVKPCLVSLIPIMNTELDETNAEEMNCLKGGGIKSDCSKSVWQIQADVNDTDGSKVKVSLVQAVAQRMSNELAVSYANDASYQCAI